MRENIVGWVATGIVATVLGVALVVTNQRVADLEAQLEKVDRSFLQLSVPVEETVRDISVIYSEIDALRAVGPTPEPATAPVRRKAATTPQSTSFQAPDYYPTENQNTRVGEQIDMAAADAMTDEQRQRALQAKNGVFNDFNPDEDDEN